MAQPFCLQRDRFVPLLRVVDHLLVLCDFDGTLVPICRHPDLCFPDPDVAGLLARLAADRRVRAGIISGRSLSDLRSRIDIPGLIYAGNHGLEIEGNGCDFRAPVDDAIVASIALLNTELNLLCQAYDGAWLEHKGLTSSLHYREANPCDVPRLLQLAREMAADAMACNKIVLREGKAVLEIRPCVNWHKGRAVRWLMDQIGDPLSPPALIYFGDDHTDEDVFTEVPDAITIFVGSKEETYANFSVPDHMAVAESLAWLADMLAKNLPATYRPA